MGKWTPFTKEMNKSKAFNSLSGRDISILIWSLQKRKYPKKKKDRKGNKIDNLVEPISNEFVFTENEAKSELDISKTTFYRSRDNLLAKGFWELIKQGGTFEQKYNVYRYSDKYLNWEPGIVFFERQFDVKRGCQGKYNHNLKNQNSTLKLNRRKK